MHDINQYRRLLREALAIIDTADGVAIPVADITTWLREARAVFAPTMTDLPTPDAVADAFVRELRNTLDATEWAAMREANGTETNPGICHSHDYCDANMVMADAFTACGVKVDVNNDAHLTLWNSAWELAMPSLRTPTAAERDAIIRAVADDMIDELQGRARDVLDYYKTTPMTSTDFVWVEEGISANLEKHGGMTEADHRAACGMVFDWLNDAHGVEPPTWFVDGGN